ncbi:MAG: metallophosphoesterase [Polyangiaceae bacterium]
MPWRTWCGSADEEVKLLLVAGDLYDDDWRTTDGAIFRRQMLELARAGARVVWIRGNYDAASQLQKHRTRPKRFSSFR